MFSSFGVKPPASGFQSYSYSRLKTHFEENGLPFWVPGVLRQHSEAAQHSNGLLMTLWGRKWSPRPIPLPSSNINF